MPRICPFNNCGAQISDVLFACPKCWRKLNYDQKRLINDAYGARDDIDQSEFDRRLQFVLDQVQPRNLFNQGKP